DLPPFYANDETLAAEIATSSAEADDPVWRMPLWEGYRADLASKVAEINNITANGFAGSITAALFLERFISSDVAWAHFDVFAWNPKARPGRPEGGEHQAGRALFDLLRRRYGGR
ncbi:MAG: leucyl aminopeptidase family protein, partial [Pseudomonadota bacterium]